MNINTSNFPEEVLQSAEPVIVDFWKNGCQPCDMIAPFLEQIATELAGKVKIVKLNHNENPELAEQYGVRLFPTLVMFKRGEVVGIYVGAAQKTELRSWISETMA
ncbi:MULTISPECIES: thioredoxin [Sinorhizobium]|uniref:thioredoxin n=1 Tax=Sinorhizobium TaxID=28105 RepID=UPI002AF6AF7C|nr:thioredoxin [Sinorhizobium medicae]WQO58349.1 thioredoxin [Sinorhizobium medicae]WQO85223.1 thioredoxin [Sinorhizobium medicae]